MMKKPLGIWLLLLAGMVCVEAVLEGENARDRNSTTEASDEENTIKSYLTGNPQKDYIFDPNLPRELNGYKLSAYPFYNSIPEDIDFKCDGLHDRFYASVPHKCQLYHHCLHGTRFDFLCANYTAFDQKTLICHFVLQVDCVNSKNYWHRNDALYEATSITTIKPQPVVISPAFTATRRLAPPPRRRAQYEYYDDDRNDYYEEPSPTRRRKRQIPGSRPVYEDEDDRYERRNNNRRQPDHRRSGDTDRIRHDSRDGRRDLEDRRKPINEGKESSGHRNRDTDSDKPVDSRSQDKNRRESDDRRDRDDDRRKHDKKQPDDRLGGYAERKTYDKKESEDLRISYDDRKPYERRAIDDRRFKHYKERDYDDRGKYDTDDEGLRYDRDRRKDSKRKPDDEDKAEGDALKIVEDNRENDRRTYDGPQKSEIKDDSQNTNRLADNEGTILVKSMRKSSAVNFKRPRIPPQIRPPVPINLQSVGYGSGYGFSFKTVYDYQKPILKSGSKLSQTRHPIKVPDYRRKNKRT